MIVELVDRRGRHCRLAVALVAAYAAVRLLLWLGEEVEP